MPWLQATDPLSYGLKPLSENIKFIQIYEITSIYYIIDLLDKLRIASILLYAILMSIGPRIEFLVCSA